MGWIQKEITVSAKKRGFCLITNEILRQVPEIERCQAGLLHLFIKHTSASLTINENADPTVQTDLEEHFKRSAPDGAPYYLHTMEGDDDMSAHIKSTTIGSSLSIPIKNGRLELGAWQGIYICEHRRKPHSRRIFISINGENIQS